MRTWSRLAVACATVLSGSLALAGSVLAEDWDYVYGSAGPLDYSEYIDVLALSDGGAILVGAYAGEFEGLSAGAEYRAFAQYRDAAGDVSWTRELDESLGGCTEPPIVRASVVDGDDVGYVVAEHCGARVLVSIDSTSVRASQPYVPIPNGYQIALSVGAMPSGVVYVDGSSSPLSLVELDADLMPVREVPLETPFGEPDAGGGIGISVSVTSTGTVWLAQSFVRQLAHLQDSLGLLRLDPGSTDPVAIQHFGYTACGATTSIVRGDDSSVWVRVCTDSVSHGALIAFDPTDGHVLGEVALPDPTASRFAEDLGRMLTTGDFTSTSLALPNIGRLVVFETDMVDHNVEWPLEVWRVDGDLDEAVWTYLGGANIPDGVVVGDIVPVGEDDFIVAGSTQTGQPFDPFAPGADQAPATRATTQAASSAPSAFVLRAAVPDADDPGGPGDPGGPEDPGEPSDPGGAAVVPIPPTRLLDTRETGRRIGADTSLDVQLAGVGDVPGDAVGVLLNVTAVGPDGPGYVAAFPCGESVPTTSNVNFLIAGGVVPNSVFVKVGDEGRVCFYSLVGTDLLVDVAGYVPRGSTVAPLVPRRLVDTRGAARVRPGNPLVIEVGGRHGVPAGAAGVFLNVTAVSPSGPGFVTAYPCGAEMPPTSNVNFSVGGGVVPNSVFVKVNDAGQVCFAAPVADTDLLVDVAGYVPRASSAVPIVPFRALDTRGAGRAGPGSDVAVMLAGVDEVAAEATGVFLNVTAVQPSGPGFVTAYPCGDPMPPTSNVNFTAGGGVVPNSVFVKLGGGGRVCFAAPVADTDLVVDVAGYTT